MLVPLFCKYCGSIKDAIVFVMANSLNIASHAMWHLKPVYINTLRI